MIRLKHDQRILARFQTIQVLHCARFLAHISTLNGFGISMGEAYALYASSMQGVSDRYCFGAEILDQIISMRRG